MRLYNKARKAELLSRYNLDAIVATSPVSVYYFTGFDCWMYRTFREGMDQAGAPESLRQAYAVVPQEGEPILVCGTDVFDFTDEPEVEVRPYGGWKGKPVERGTAQGSVARYRRCVSFEKESPEAALLTSLDSLGVARGRLAVEPGNMNVRTKATLARKDGLTVLDGTQLVRQIRMVKTAEELRRIRAAAEITERGMIKALATAKPGMAAGRMTRVFRQLVSTSGAEVDHFTYSPNGLGMTDREDHIIGNKGCMFIDCGCRYRQYYSDTGTTILLSSGGNKEAAIYERMWNVFESCADELRHGTLPSEILGGFEARYRKQGVKGVDYEGHGIGLEPRETPVIGHTSYRMISDDVSSQDVNAPLEAGMVINLESSLFLPGRASYQLEKTFLIGHRRATEMTPLRKSVLLTCR